MKNIIIGTVVAAVIAGWALPSLAREAVALPGVVGAEGQLNGVDTAGAGTLTIGNNQNINTNNDLGGGITSNAAATAIADFLGSSTVTGFTGTVGANLLRIDAGRAGSTVNFNGDVFSQTLRVMQTGTINFNGNVIAAPEFTGDGFINLGANRSIIGAITTLTAGTGTLTLNNGSSVTGAIGGASGIRMINLGGNASITGAVQTAGFSLGINTLDITGALTTNAGATIRTTIFSNLLFGNITAGTSNINAGGITVIPTVTGVVTQGTNFRIVDAPAGTIGASVFVVNNNPRYLFSGVPTTTGDVNIFLTSVLPLAGFVTTPGALAVAPILDVNAAPGSDLLVIQNAIAVLPNAAAINNALAQLAPGTTNIAAPWVAGQSMRLFEDLWMARIDEIQGLCCDTCDPNNPRRSANTEKCEGPDKRGSWWGKGFGNRGSQDNANNMNGYDTRALGVMLAYDKPVTEQTRVGFGGGYANTEVDGNNSSGDTTIDSYQLTGYIAHTDGPVFIQGSLMAGIDKYEGSRSIIFPGINRVAKADFDGQQYGALVMAGKHFFADQTTITPFVSLQVSRIEIDSYTEKGAGDANLRIDSQSYNFVQSGLGVKAERIIQSGNNTYSPEIHAKWLHDFESTTMHQDARFTGGGGKFSADGIKQDRDLFNVGVGVTFLSCNCKNETWTIKGLYDYKWNQTDYSADEISLLASFKF